MLDTDPFDNGRYELDGSTLTFVSSGEKRCAAGDLIVWENVGRAEIRVSSVHQAGSWRSPPQVVENLLVSAQKHRGVDTDEQKVGTFRLPRSGVGRRAAEDADGPL